MGCSDEQRRGLILSCASRLFDEHGAAKTTIADIAREAGIGVGSVYLEFCSKDAIVAELSRSRHHRVIASMMQAAGSEHPSYESRIEAVLLARLTAFLSLASEGAHAPELVHCTLKTVRENHSRFLDEERAFLTRLLEEGVASGELDADDCDAVARAIQIAHGALSPPVLYELDPNEAQQDARRLLSLVLRGVLKRR